MSWHEIDQAYQNLYNEVVRVDYEFAKEIVKRTILEGFEDDENGIQWEVRKNDNLLKGLLLFVRYDHLGEISQLETGEKLS